MRTIRLMLLAALLAFTGPTLFANQGDDGEDRSARRGGSKIGVHLNLAPMAFGTYSLNAEYNFADNMSAVATLGYTGLNIETTTYDGNGNPVIDETGYNGFIFVPEFRFFFDPSRKDNDNYFAGGFIKYRNWSTSGEAFSTIDINGDLVSYDETNNGISAGITTGRIWTTKAGFTVSVWSGIGYFLYNNTSKTVDFEESPSILAIENNLPALDFRLGVCLGWRF